MTSSGRCAQNAPARLSLSLLCLSPSLFVPRSCVFVYTSESKGSSQKARYTRKWGEMEIGDGEEREKERKGGHCYLHKPALASVGDIGASVSSVQRGEEEREKDDEEEEEEVKWTCYEIIEGDGERDDGGE